MIILGSWVEIAVWVYVHTIAEYSKAYSFGQVFKVVSQQVG